ncbi:hypothetical protein MASR1M31_10090 [Porphyromonadaceae bacterium]
MNIFYYQEKITSNQRVIDKIKPISRLLVVAKLLFFLLFATSAYGWIAYSEVAYPLLTTFLAFHMLSRLHDMTINWNSIAIYIVVIRMR